MKKILILFVVISVHYVAFAQGKEGLPIFKKNELSLNLPTTIFASFIDISYEQILAEDFSIGASAGFSLKEPNNDNFAGIKFLFTPHARWYFGGSTESMQRYAAGLFIEVNAALVSALITDRNTSNLNQGTNKENDYVGFGLGIAMGWKYVTRNNWVGQFYSGLGKVFSNSKVYPRVGITIGKRF